MSRGERPCRRRADAAGQRRRAPSAASRLRDDLLARHRSPPRARSRGSGSHTSPQAAARRAVRQRPRGRSRLAIQLTERRVVEDPRTVEHVVVRDERPSCTSSNRPQSRSRSSHSGSSSQRRSAASCSTRTSRTNSAGRGSGRSRSPGSRRSRRLPPGRSTRAISGSARSIVEPVECLRGEDGVHRPVVERDPLGRARERVTPGTIRSSIARMFASGSTAVTCGTAEREPASASRCPHRGPERRSLRRQAARPAPRADSQDASARTRRRRCRS